MDLSALIFVALAVAWGVYLVPKALRHAEDSAAARTVEAVSDRVRVLARREAVTKNQARLVVGPGRPTTDARPVEDVVLTPAQVRARRRAAASAARRRRRVVGLILLSLVAVGALAALSVIAPVWLAAPAGVLLVWLVACRLMVRRELAELPARRLPVATLEDTSGGSAEEVDEAEAGSAEEPTDDSLTDEIEAVTAPDPEPAPAGPAGWDPVPVTLPTYTQKDAARRTVRTIDLDSTGVWTSGPSEADSALAREADQADQAARAATSAEDAEAARRRHAN